MSVMSSIRHNMGLVVIVIFVALAAFILMDMFSGLNRGGGRTRLAAAEVAGKTVYMDEYNERVTKQLQNLRSQGSDISPDQEYQVKRQVWDMMMQEAAYDKELNDVGINISGTELHDMIAGENIDPFIKQQFEPILQQQKKVFTPQSMQWVLQNISSPEQQEFFKNVETYLDRKTAQGRYDKWVSRAFVGSKAMATQNYKRDNRKANIRFLKIPFTAISDSLVKVSDNEMRSYLMKNKSEYKQESDETIIQYVEYKNLPTKADTLRSFSRVNNKAQEFAKTDKDSLYTRSKSSVPFTGQYVPFSYVSPSIKDAVRSAQPKSTFGPFLERGSYVLYKLVGTQPSTDQISVKLNHIVITPEGSTKADSTKAFQKASSLKRKANSSNFGDLAKENSDDTPSKDIGGEIGWYGGGGFGDDFDKAVKKASKGQIIGPLKGRRGYHVVQVVDRETNTYSIAQIDEQIYAGDATTDSVEKMINMFASRAGKSGNLKEFAASANIPSLQSAPLSFQNSSTVQGITGSRKLVTWATAVAKNNEFSSVVAVPEGSPTPTSFLFAQVIDKKKAGVKNLDDVRFLVQSKVRNEKKAKDILAKLQGTTLDDMKNSFGSGASISEASDVSFSSSSITGMGSEPYVIGRVAGMKQGEVSKPIVGNNGVYVVEVKTVTDSGEPDAATISASVQQGNATGQRSLQSSLSQAVKKLANVKDSRADVERQLYQYQR